VPTTGNEISEILSSADEDEETEITASKYKYRKLIKQIREYLKMKLPSYSVPSGKVQIIY
jgi:L-2-aminoadipate reductase